MLVWALAIVVALGLVLFTHGSITRVASMPVQRLWMLFAGLALQIGLEYLPIPRARYGDVGLTLLLVSYVLLLGFCVSNLRITALSVVLIGVAMNTLVIGLNAGMPYRAPASVKKVTTVKHRPERPGDVLAVLSDRIELGGPFRTSISFGDLVIAIGLIDVLYRAGKAPASGRRRRTSAGGATRAPAGSAPPPSARRGSDEVGAPGDTLDRRDDARVVHVTRP